jgi:sulfite reductase (NADPH) flavoprotein alpha-component
LHIFIIAWLLMAQRNGNKSEVQDDHAYLVVYASQSGHAESWAKHTVEQLQLIDQQVTLKNIQQLTITDLTQYQRILWVVSTYGEGDAPDDAQHFVHKILPQPIDLSHLSFAILALGDKRYTNFCQFGQSIEQWLLTKSPAFIFHSSGRSAQ